MQSRAVTAILLVLLLGGCAALLLVCGKSGKARYEPTPDLNGTYCEKLKKLPPGHPRGPLPSDARLAQWTVEMESVIETFFAHEALENNHSRLQPLSGPDDACEKELFQTLRKNQPEKQAILQAYGVEQEDCRSLTKFWGHFPDNARLRRALIAIYRGCVEDNFNSIDGELDRNEAFLRLTAIVFPERLGIDFELLTDDDGTVKTDTMFVWSNTAFGRTSLDLGMTGNALKVVRDITKSKPELAKQFLPTARKWAESPKLASHRRARWQALVAYIEAGAPDPGDPAEPELARAIERDMPSARWALAFIPNELEEHAPRPYPYVKDTNLIRATTARTESLTTEEDVVLGLDAVSRMPPGTALEWIAKHAGSSTKGVSKAAISAINRQIEQLPLDDKATDDSLSPDDDKPRAKNTAKLLKPIQQLLITTLRPRICTDHQAFDLILKSDNKSIDADFVTCLGPNPKPSQAALETVFQACLYRREYGWQLTAKTLESAAPPGDEGSYARRVAKGCRTGND
jgi:hypothetical protein